jgi:hypothetical protein
MNYSVCAATADRCPDYYFGPGSLRTVENVEACIPTLKQATCTDVDMGLKPACLVNGLGAANDACGASSQCASGVCFSTTFPCETCQVAGAIGAGCDLYTPCAAGGICSPGTRTCVAWPVTHATEGQPCAYGGNPLIGCEGDLVCVPTTRYGSTGTCQSMPKQGETCLDHASGGFYGLPQCAPGFACGIDRSDGLRTARCGNPAPCGKTVCDVNSYCYETPTVFNECRAYSLPGQACTVSWGEHNCASGSVCVPAADGGDQGTCVAIVEVGLGEACNATATCKSPSSCQSGRCTSYDPASCLQSADGGP